MKAGAEAGAQAAEEGGVDFFSEDPEAGTSSRTSRTIPPPP